MSKRKAITDKMKWQSAMYWGSHICPECKQPISFCVDEIQWDHRHALVHEGPHEYRNIRPLHVECHKKKTARDVAAKAKGDRILGLTCAGPKKKIQSRPFSKKHQRLEREANKRSRSSFRQSPWNVKYLNEEAT